MKKISFIAILLISVSLFAQKKAPQNWQLLDPRDDKVFGTSSEKAYKNLKGRKSTTVIVAVIDAGIDINHEDLKDIIWVNTKEIPGNGIDDDNNGYVDDINGWSFIGGKNGDIKDEASELSRLYFKLNNKFKNADTLNLSVYDAKEFAEFKKIRKDYMRELAVNEQQLESIKILSLFIDKVKKQNNGEFSKKALKSYVPDNEREEKFQKRLKFIFTLGLKPEELNEQISKGKEIFESRIKMSKMNADSIRKVIVGDDVNNPYEKNYGSSNVIGPEAMHGTHVAGIIAAVRNNGKGMDGIAGNVKIMVLRAVPNGDERDKDIANAIRYAADNGAKIINMSFGKYYSPDKKVIDEAVQYALSKDVLLVHGAGNESKDEDVEQSYPSRYFLSGNVAPNWLEVGANSYKKGKKIIASFSNYGKTHVDIFAPGVDVYSCIPDNKYESNSGTSMASPSAAGVAALIRSYFPELTASQVKELLIKTATPYKKKVVIPGKKKEKSRLENMSVSGGIINADNAVLELLKKK